MSKKLGFTLAEVLITLGIIGVVAAMTIPTLLSNTNDQEYKTGFKKAMSTLNQAVTMSIALDGTDFSGLVSGTGANSVYNMFTTRMNVVSTGANSVMNGGNLTFNSASNYTLFFNDGMAITFPQAGSQCIAAGAAGCSMLIDVNGAKKPNTIATTTTAAMRDEYTLYFYNQQVIPADATSKYILTQ